MDQEFFMKELDKEFKPNHEPVNGLLVFTEEDYQELQRNLVLYKEGNQEAVTYIVRTFHPFITKYARFIKFGNLPYTKITNKKGNTFNKVSPTISSFVSLFIEKHGKISKEERRQLFSKTCVKIKLLFDKYEYGDIYNELVLALLNMANKYKITKEGDKYHKKNGTFHMYVSKCFHWEAYRFLSKLIKDPITHFNALSLINEFGEVIDREDLGEGIGNSYVISSVEAEKDFDKVIENVSRQNNIDKSNTLTIKEVPGLDAYDLASLNFNWTNGVTCSDLFAVLSSYEREIILLSFIEKKTDVEIAKKYGCHRATINEHKKKAIRKIQEKAKLLNLI